MVLAPPPPRTSGATDENFHWMDAREERDVFDEQVRAILGISGAEFLARLDRGFYADALDDRDHRDLTYLAMLANIVR